MAEEDFQPSDALPPTGQDRRGLAGIGAFLPMTVPKTTPYGEVSLSDIEMGIPPALKDAYSGIMKFGALMRGELTPQDIQQLAFDTSMNVTGGSLLGSKLLPKAVPKGALGMGTSKITKQDEFFEAMGEEGARLEYPRINDLLFKYEDRNNRKALETAFADPDYTQYKEVLDANLLRMFPDGKIPLQRITNYAEVMNKGAKKNIEKRTFDIEEIAFAGNDAERELVVNLNGDLRSFSLAKSTDVLNLGSGSLFSPEIKKGRKLLIVSCSADKCPDPGDMEAFDRYTGDMFKSIKKQGIPEENVDLAIMSAKYGLIRRDTKIPNYNVKMNKEIANNLLNDPTQVNRIKNTVEGYDEVVVEGSSLYKDVIKEAAGDAPITDYRLDYEKTLSKGERSNYGSGRQKQSVGKFIRSNTPQDVFHYTQADVPPTVFDVNKLSPYDPLSTLGLHVSTNPKAAMDRFAALKTSTIVNTLYRGGMPLEEALKKGAERRNQLIAGPPIKTISGNQGYDASGKPIPTTTSGSSMPLKADLSKPFLNPKTNKPFSETELFRFTETPPDGFIDFVTDSTVKNSEMIRKKLAEDGFTHIPYVNDFEAKGEISMIMLIDRPKGSKAVLKGKFGKNDPRERTNPDIMKEEGGVVSMKDKAININRGPRGIEPFVQYFENGGIVQSVKDYIGSFFEEEPIVPERNVFEEQRIVAENSPYPKDIPIVQTEKEALSNLADREMGLEMMRRVGFDPLAYKIMQAGLRDNRTLSDFLEIYPTVTTDMTKKQQKDALTDKLRGLGLASGMYFPLDNMIVIEPMDTAVSYFQSPTDMFIMHEVLHKGAETLKKDPNVNIKSLREMLDTKDYENIGDDTKRGRAEHRYIQAIVNKAYLDNMLTNSSIYANRELARAEKIIKDPKARVGEKIIAESTIKNVPKYIDRDKKQDIIKEIRRSTEMYLEPSSKELFKKHMEILHPEKGLFDRDKVYVEENFNLNELKQIYDTLNMIMLNEPGTKEFALEMSKAAPAGASIRGYSDLFPQQFADPVRTYEKTYTDVTPDMSYIDVMTERDKFLRKARKKRQAEENKAEGGVIGLKDKAVNMYRNRL